MKQTKRTRVLLAKAGLDGHNRGIQLVGRALRDAGMEVVYGGLRITPEQTKAIAIQEDVDVIGISIFSGGLMTIIPKICRALQEDDSTSEIPLIVGGIVPPQDAEELKKMGVHEIFGPGSDLEDIVTCVQKLAESTREEEL